MLSESGRELKLQRDILKDLDMEIIIQTDLIKDTAEKIIELDGKLTGQKSELKFLEKQQKICVRDTRKLERKYAKEKAGNAIPTFSKGL